jgi:hypothetical protein
MFRFLLESPLDIPPRQPLSCLKCLPPTNRVLENVRTSGPRSSKIPLSDPWVPYRRLGLIQLVHSCYMSTHLHLSIFAHADVSPTLVIPLTSVFRTLLFMVTPKTFLSVLRWQSSTTSLSLPEQVKKPCYGIYKWKLPHPFLTINLML